MAGESLNYSEIKNWYDVFNEVITKYGGNEITSLTPPEQGGKAQPADINNLYNKISEFVADEYLGTQPTLYDTDYSVVSSGSLIIRTATTPISNTTSKLTEIQCRNKITYTSGAKSNGSHDNGTKSNTACGKGACSRGTKTNVWRSNGSHSLGGKTSGSKSNGSHSNGSNGNGTNTNGYHGQGTHSNGANSNGDNSNGALIDIKNANTSY